MPENLRPNGPLSCVSFFFLARVYTIIGAFFAFTAFTLCPFFEAFPLEIFHPQWLDVLCFIREVKAVKAGDFSSIEVPYSPKSMCPFITA